MIEQLIHIDHQLFDFINQDLSNPVFDVVMPFLRNKKTWIPFYFLVALGLYKTKGKKGILMILSGVMAIGIADGISSHVLKPFFERTRPCLLADFSNHVLLVVEKCSGAYSFPSSHAANHFALAIFLILALGLQNKLVSFSLLTWASLICFAQVYVGVHFPSDVLAGSILGILSGMISYFIFTLLLKKV